MKNNAKKNIYLGIILIILIIVGIFWSKGFRLQPNFKISKNGEVILNIPFKNTTVYIDSKKYKITTDDSEAIKISLSTKAHNLTTERAGYFPWTKDVVVQSKSSQTINPVFISQNTVGQIITKNDPDYFTIRLKVRNTTLPTKDSPRALENGDMVWVDNNIIFVKKEGKIFEVFKPSDKIRSVDFYKNKSENVLFASDVGVYLIDTDSTGFQNFFPIYKGISPIFNLNNESSIFVLDGENLMAVMI